MRLNDCLYCLQKMSTPTFFSLNSVTLYLYRLSSSSKHLLRLSKDCCIFFVSKSFLSVWKNLISHCMHKLVLPLFFLSLNVWKSFFREIMSHGELPYFEFPIVCFVHPLHIRNWYTAFSRKLMAWCDDCGNKRLYLVLRRPSHRLSSTQNIVMLL